MHVELVSVNRTEGYRCGKHVEIVEGETAGEIYRGLMRAFGRCIGKVFVDNADGGARHVGWVFVKRQEYDDAPRELFTCETWATVVECVPEQVRAIGIDALN